ncbi:mucin-5AC-like isoform X1 [Labrus bergylta]|uniref:mucin-5AC-like isoform X1 n=1 Tax=Labrus bergylta TaxID=56723 RepID=UPI0033134A12
MDIVCCEGCLTLSRTRGEVTNLQENIRRLSEGLQKKDLMLSSYIDLAASQSKRITAMHSDISDTLLWDPLRPRHSSCSTPNPRESWAEVLVSSGKCSGRLSGSPPPLLLTNHYSALQDDDPGEVNGTSSVSVRAPTDPVSCTPESAKPASDATVTAAASFSPNITAPSTSSVKDDATSASSPPVLALSSPSSAASSSPVAAPAAVSVGQQSQQWGKLSSHSRRLLVEAVNRRSGGLPRTQLERSPSPERSPALTAPPQPVSPLCPDVTRHARVCTVGTQASPPRPLFSPTTLIIGDSIIRNVRFFNATTLCLPGATVPVILERLQKTLPSLPTTITRLIINVGTNDTSRQQSELTKEHFNQLFKLLIQTGKSIFISRPTAPLSNAARFSRTLYLHHWLQSTCRAHDVAFIDNFNLLWNRYSLFKADGLHPNKAGSHLLTTNIQHTVQYTPCN